VEIYVVPTGSIGGVIAPSMAGAQGPRTKLVSMDDNVK
jgi:hypothetical protein